MRTSRPYSYSCDKVSQAAGLSVLILMTFAGCKGGAFDWSWAFPNKEKGVVDTKDHVDPLADSAVYRDSVAEYAYFDGLRRLRVRGYGVVVGLGESGCTRCPNSVAQQLIQEMYKTREFVQQSGRRLTPERLLNDPDTAVVAVEGEIPAAATKGTTFDLVVRAIPGTDTSSLEGGTLFECNLQVFRQTGAAGWIPGKSIAKGSGEIFQNPFGQSETAATRSNVREGMVIGGGRSLEDRRLRLLLAQPSYPMAIRIADAINQRFGTVSGKIADALSPGEVTVNVPSSHQHDPKHFVAVVLHLFPGIPPQLLAQRARDLAIEFERIDAPHVEIALAWEAIGADALPEARKFYDHVRPACSFYSAAAGVLLGDEMATDAIALHLEKPSSPYRHAAIRTLSTARNSARAARPLRRALNDGDIHIRSAAYEALRLRDDPAITSIAVGQDRFHIDLVAGEGQPLVYVKRSEDPRIVLFGKNLSARPPVFYGSPDDSLMIDAPPDASQLTIVRRSRRSGHTSPPLSVDPNVARLIAFLGNDPPTIDDRSVTGLGVTYQNITRLLSEWCQSRSIDAQFLLETEDDGMRSRAGLPAGRRESDL